MKKFMTDLLICPTCLPDEIPLLCHESEQRDDEIWAGVLECRECGNRYVIEEGIATILPADPAPSSTTASKYETQQLVSSYLWSHYSDIISDPYATDAYSRWSVQVNPDTGMGLDVGCAVGRFTFELARKLDMAIGLDTSKAFVRAARELASRGRFDAVWKVEGNITESQLIDLPEGLETKYVDFIVADAQKLPFSANLFSVVASLNLIDKVPHPGVHLKELDRVAKNEKAQFLLSDPYSWSREIADESAWLGGVLQGKYQGRGEENIKSIISTEFLPPWIIHGTGEIWWKIRNHSNHFELVRSLYIKADR